MEMSRQVRRQIERLAAKGYTPDAIRMQFSGRRIRILKTAKGPRNGKVK